MLRVLARTESNTEASVKLVRMLRSGGVLSRGMHEEIRCRTQEALSVPDWS